MLHLHIQHFGQLTLFCLSAKMSYILYLQLNIYIVFFNNYNFFNNPYSKWGLVSAIFFLNLKQIPV